MLRVQNYKFEQYKGNNVKANLTKKKINLSFEGQDNDIDFKKLSGIQPYIDFKIQNIKEQKQPKHSQDSARVAYNASKKLFNLGKYEEAKVLYLHANEANRNTLNPNDKFYQEFVEFGGDIFQKTGDIKTSRGLYLGVFQSMAESDTKDEDLARILNKIAETHVLQNDIENAEEFLDDSLEISKTPALVVKNLLLRGYNDSNKNKLINSEQHIKLAATIEKSNKIQMDNDLSLALSLVYRKNGKFEESNKVCRQNLDSLRNKDRINSSQFVYSLIVLGANNYDIYSENPDKNNKNLTKSINAYKNALALSEKQGTSNSTDLICNNIGTIYFEQNDHDKAKKYLSKVVETQENSQVLDNETLQSTYSMLGQIYLKENNSEKASHYFEEERRILILDNPSRLLKKP